MAKSGVDVIIDLLIHLVLDGSRDKSSFTESGMFAMEIWRPYFQMLILHMMETFHPEVSDLLKAPPIPTTKIALLLCFLESKQQSPKNFPRWLDLDNQLVYWAQNITKYLTISLPSQYAFPYFQSQLHAILLNT